MSAAAKSSLYGGLFGLFVGVACEAHRDGLGECRSFEDIWIMLVAMIVIGVVSPRLRRRAANACRRTDDEPSGS